MGRPGRANPAWYEQAPRVESSISAMRVLVVEDDPGVRDGILALLRSRHFDAAAASNGAVALEILPSAKPDVILLDLAMPGVAGDEFLEKMRADPELEHIPVIVMSAWARRIEPPFAIAGWLPKPFEPRELLDILGSLPGSTDVPSSENGAKDES